MGVCTKDGQYIRMAVQVTCGSVIKLKHAASGYDLHSHEISYGSGSGQQSVTGYQDTSDANSLWSVHGAKVMHALSACTAKFPMQCAISLHGEGLSGPCIMLCPTPDCCVHPCMAGGGLPAGDAGEERHARAAAAHGHAQVAA